MIRFQRAALALPILLALSIASGSLPAQAPAPAPPLIKFDIPLARKGSDPFEPLRGLAKQGLEKTNAPGLAVALVKNDKLAWTEGFGFADVENEVPVRPNTAFRIASISKPITATAVMQLVQRGLVGLDDPIQRYVPSFPDKGAPVSIRHLLTHTSGIRHYKDGEFDNKESYDSLEQAFTIFKDDPLLFPPGSKYSYSTYGYNLLAGVIERVSGVSFEQYLERHIWGPAEMADTRLEHPQEIVKHRARQYVHDEAAGLRNAPYADLSIKWAGGGMISTASDLARFHIALNRGKLIDPKTLDEMYTTATLTDGTKTEYGLGWQSVLAEGRRWIAHSGGATGGTTYLLRSPEDKLAVVILANVQNARGLRELALAYAKTLAN
jgi:serine beta-lactamase-like protein LACTB